MLKQCVTASQNLLPTFPTMQHSHWVASQDARICNSNLTDNSADFLFFPAYFYNNGENLKRGSRQRISKYCCKLKCWPLTPEQTRTVQHSSPSVSSPWVRRVADQRAIDHKAGRPASVQIDSIDHPVFLQELCHLPEIHTAHERTKQATVKEEDRGTFANTK